VAQRGRNQKENLLWSAAALGCGDKYFVSREELINSGGAGLCHIILSKPKTT